jgi:hypothetical protein
MLRAAVCSSMTIGEAGEDKLGLSQVCPAREISQAWKYQRFIFAIAATEENQAVEPETGTLVAHAIGKTSSSAHLSVLEIQPFLESCGHHA